MCWARSKFPQLIKLQDASFIKRGYNTKYHTTLLRCLLLCLTIYTGRIPRINPEQFIGTASGLMTVLIEVRGYDRTAIFNVQLTRGRTFTQTPNSFLIQHHHQIELRREAQSNLLPRIKAHSLKSSFVEFQKTRAAVRIHGDSLTQ